MGGEAINIHRILFRAASVPLVSSWCAAGEPLVCHWCASGCAAGEPLVYRWWATGVPLVRLWCAAVATLNLARARKQLFTLATLVMEKIYY